MQNEPLSQLDRALYAPQCRMEYALPSGGDALPDVPILLSTRLQLELLLQEPVLDLRAVSEVILQDMGATLQILRLVGNEYRAAEERPIRIEDCIASLETRAWFDAVSAITLVQNSAAAGTWQHAKQIGRYAEELAGRQEGVKPGEAQIVGLLHEIGSLPELLDWPRAACTLHDQASVAAALAEHWHLPGCVLAAAREEQTQCASVWTGILHQAHQCVQEEEARARLDCEASA